MNVFTVVVILVIILLVVYLFPRIVGTARKKRNVEAIKEAQTLFCPRCGRQNLPEARFCGACGAVLTAAPTPTATEAAVAYAGFWLRFGALVIDLVIVQIANAIVSALLIPLSLAGGMGVILFAYGGDLLVTVLLPALYFVLLTGQRGQTLGKMALGIKVVDEAGQTPGLKRALQRETLGKFVSTIALGLGFLWVAWDKEKQGWHDKIARTHVILVRNL